jgi:hypothetical protein
MSARGATKISNEYARGFAQLYTKTPKAVFAAVVWSWGGGGVGNPPELTRENFLKEWKILFDSGIVKQKPPCTV